MSKAPERIWARPDYNECWHKRLEEEDVEYVRADLYAALEAEIARLTAERNAALAGGVKVKPLVWEPHPFSQSTIEECAIADAPFKQRYQIQRDPWATTYIAMLYPRIPISDSTLWWESKGHADMASAREAAQADYEARILAAIQPDPDARQADLAKAFCMGRDAAAAWHTMQAETAMGALCCGSDNYEIRRAGRVSDMHRGYSEAIRALTPPADPAAKIGGE